METGDQLILKEEDRTKLDGIVSQMNANKEPDANIQFVVNDFKTKYGQKKKEEPYSYSFDTIKTKTGELPKPISTQEVVPTDLATQQAEAKKKETLRQGNLSNQIVDSAHNIKLPVKDYIEQNIVNYGVGKFGTDAAKAVYNSKDSVSRSTAMEALTKGMVDEKLAAEKLLTDGYKTEVVPVGSAMMEQTPQIKKVPLSQEEKNNLRQHLTDIDRQLNNTKFYKNKKQEDIDIQNLPEDDRKKMFGEQGFKEQGFNQFPQQKHIADFINENKTDIAEKFPELIKLLPENPTSQDIMKAYYAVKVQEYKNSESELDKLRESGINSSEMQTEDVLKKALHTVTGTLFMSEDEQKHIALGRELTALTPIVSLGVYTDSFEDKNMGSDILTSIMKGFYPDWKGTTKVDRAQSIVGALDHLNIPKEKINEFAHKAVTDASSPSFSQELVSGVLETAGTIPRLLLMGAVTEGAAAATGLNALIDASASSSSLATRVGSFMMERSKDISIFALSGSKNPIVDGLAFGTGTALFGKFGNAVKPIVGKIMGDAGAKAVDVSGKFIGAGMGMTAGNEMNNYVSSAYNVLANDSNFKKELTDRGYFDKDGNWTLSNAAKNTFKQFIIGAQFGFLTIGHRETPKAKQEFGKLADELEKNNVDPQTVQTLRDLSRNKDGVVKTDADMIGEEKQGFDGHPLEDVIRANKQILDFHMKGQRPTYKPEQVAQATTIGLPSPKDNIFLKLPQGEPGKPVEPAQPIPVWDRNTGEHKQIFPDKDGFYEVKKSYGYPEDMKFQLLPDGSMKIDGKYEEIPLPEQGGVMLKYKGKEQTLVQHDTPSGKSAQVVTKGVEKEKQQKGVATTTEGTATPIAKKEKGKKSSGVVETDTGEKIPIKKKETPLPSEQPPPPVVETTPQDFEKGQREVSAPISDINTATDLFQNRTKEFSQETVDSIKNDVKDGKFDPNKLDAIRIWKDPKDGKTYVISGHSRLEAFKQLDAEGAKGFDNIPAIDMSNLTLEQAKDFATKESNTMASRESLHDRAKVYRKMMDAKESDASVIREAKKNEKDNWKYVYHLAHLDPKGKAMSDIEAFDKTSDEENKKKTQSVGNYIGELKSRNPELTTQQENEIHDYLMDNMDKHTSRAKFIEFAEKRIETLKKNGALDGSVALNLERQVSKSDVERNYDNKVSEARKTFDEARSLYDAKKDEFVSRGVSPEEMTEALKAYKDGFDVTAKDLSDLLKQKAMVKEAAKSQMSMWDMLEDKLKKSIEKSKSELKDMKGQVLASSIIGFTPEHFNHIEVTAKQLALGLIQAGKSVDHILEVVGKYIDSQVQKIKDSNEKKNSELNRNKDNEIKVAEIKKDINKGNEDIKKLQDIIHHEKDGLKTLLDTEKMKLLPEGVRYDDDATKRITDEIKARIDGEDKKNLPVDKLKTFALDYFKESLQDTKKISSEGATKIIDRINGADTHIKLTKAINSITTIMRKEKMGELYDESKKSKSTFQNAKDQKKFAPLSEPLKILGRADINNMPVEFQVRYNEMAGLLKGTVNAEEISSLADEARQFINARVSESGMKKREFSPEQRAEYHSVLKQRADLASVPSHFLPDQKKKVGELLELIKNNPDKFTDSELQQTDQILDDLANGWEQPQVENIVANVKAEINAPEASTRILKDNTFEKWLRYYWAHPTLKGKTYYEKLRNMNAPYKAAFLEYVKDGKESIMYNNLWGKHSTSSTKSKVEVDKFNDRYTALESKLGKTGEDKIRSSIRVGMYAATKENSVGSLDRVDRSMKSMIKSGETQKNHKGLFDAHMDAYNNFYLNPDGKISTSEKLWSKLADTEKKVYTEGRNDLDGHLKDKSEYITTYVNGNSLSPVENYAHLNIIGITGKEIPTNESAILSDLMERGNVNAKDYITLDTQSSHERQYPEGGIYNFDFIGNMKKLNSDVTYLYHKAPVIKEIRAFLNHPSLKESLGDDRWKAVKKDITESILLDKASPDRSGGYDFVSNVSNNARASVLMMPIARQVSEGFSQALVSVRANGLGHFTSAIGDIAQHGDVMRKFAEKTGMSTALEYAKDIKWGDTQPRFTGMNSGIGEWWHRTDVARASKAMTEFMGQMNTSGWRNVNKAGGFANLYKAMADAGIEKPDWGTMTDAEEWHNSLSPSQKSKLQDVINTSNMNQAKQVSPSSSSDEANAFRMQEGEDGMQKFGKTLKWFLSHYTRAEMARQINATVDLGKAVGNGDLKGIGNSAFTMGTGVAQAMAYKFLMTQIGGLAARGAYAAYSAATGKEDKSKTLTMVERANEGLTAHGLEKEAIGSLVESYISGYSIPLRYALGDLAEEVNALFVEHAGDNPLHYNKDRDAITYTHPLFHDLASGEARKGALVKVLSDMYMKNLSQQGMKVDNLEKAIRGQATGWETTDAAINLVNTFFMLNPAQKMMDDFMRQQTDKQIEEAKTPMTQEEYEETKNYKEELKQVKKEMMEHGIDIEE